MFVLNQGVNVGTNQGDRTGPGPGLLLEMALVHQAHPPAAAIVLDSGHIIDARLVFQVIQGVQENTPLLIDREIGGKIHLRNIREVRIGAAFATVAVAEVENSAVIADKAHLDIGLINLIFVSIPQYRGANIQLLNRSEAEFCGNRRTTFEITVLRLANIDEAVIEIVDLAQAGSKLFLSGVGVDDSCCDAY